VFTQPDTLLPDPYDPQALNRYSYALNNPLRYNDPSGHYIESGIDLAFIAMDLNDIRTGNADTWTYLGLGVDLVCLALPGATGGRLAVSALEEGVTHADNVGDLFNLMDTTLDAEKKLDNTIDASRSAEDIVNVEKTVDNTMDALTVSDNIPESAYEIAAQIKNRNGIPLKNYKGGRPFENDGRNGGQTLPQNIKYKEYDINPYVKGQDRGNERIVIGNDGSVWYTDDHYQTFTQIE
jgi:pyocin large subunit-like protein